MTQLNSDNNVVFGTGPLGLAVMDALVDRGRQITLVNRSATIRETLPPGVELVQGDATQPDEVREICQNVDVVFHCAQPPYHQWPALFPALTQGIADGLSGSGANWLI